LLIGKKVQLEREEERKKERAAFEKIFIWNRLVSGMSHRTLKTS
jgi:hypothetical protein